jgi:hypothetical protein
MHMSTIISWALLFLFPPAPAYVESLVQRIFTASLGCVCAQPEHQKEGFWLGSKITYIGLKNLYAAI